MKQQKKKGEKPNYFMHKQKNVKQTDWHLKFNWSENQEVELQRSS